MTPAPKILNPIMSTWFKNQGYKPFPFQKRAWELSAENKSFLLQVPTGSGKTYAAVLEPLGRLIENPSKKLKIIYITPLRALSRDIEHAIKRPLLDLKSKMIVESRTGDTSYSRKKRQFVKSPQVLVTTPESLSLLLTYQESEELLSELETVIVDEWHELLGSKRGNQMELCLSFLKNKNSNLQIIGMSATLGNAQEAAQTLVGTDRVCEIINSDLARKVEIEVIMPPNMGAYPLAGHLGLKLLDSVCEKISFENTTLIFINTRNQAEIWYQHLKEKFKDLESEIALHHGSIDRKTRLDIETGIKNGTFKLVVCTSSLDLGVDFPTVDQVFQIGSPKGIGRLIQRAGRAKHQPGKTSKVYFVPTHGLEVIEVAALRKALADKVVEERRPLQKPFDVLIQHCLTLACELGFEASDLFRVVKTAYSYRDLSQKEFDDILEFVQKGGNSLSAYSQYKKIYLDDNGKYYFTNAYLAKLHRTMIGTIASASSVQVQFLSNKKKLGFVEEQYAAKLKKGDIFVFAGRLLEFVKMWNMTCIVRPVKNRTQNVPHWFGARMQMSSLLASELRDQIVTVDHLKAKEKERIASLLDMQKKLSAIPRQDQILIETFTSREGLHYYIYPFAGRNIHEYLGTILSFRLSQKKRGTYRITFNDYGLEIFTSDKNNVFYKHIDREMFKNSHVTDELKDSLNFSEINKRQFRAVSQISGLIYTGYPGASGSQAKQVQASSELIFEVFKKYEPSHILLKQAEQEVLHDLIDVDRLKNVMSQLENGDWILKDLPQPSPLSFPLMVDRLGASVLSNESLKEKIERMKSQWIEA